MWYQPWTAGSVVAVGGLQTGTEDWRKEETGGTACKKGKMEKNGTDNMSKLSKNIAWQAIINEKPKSIWSELHCFKTCLQLKAAEPVRITVTSLVWGLARTHLAPFRQESGEHAKWWETPVQTQWLVDGSWRTHQGSGLRHKHSVERLAEQQIHTFKHCLCFNPTHPGTWALLPIRRHWVSCRLGSFTAHRQMPADEYRGSRFSSSVLSQQNSAGKFS